MYHPHPPRASPFFVCGGINILSLSLVELAYRVDKVKFAQSAFFLYSLQVCKDHGTDFLEYKCRYCCSVAIFFCFGCTHFCAQCHEFPMTVLDMPKANLPKCPAGPRGVQLTGACPLKINHPPTGEEFSLGCGICSNAETF